jgi:hypothetical protein
MPEIINKNNFPEIEEENSAKYVPHFGYSGGHRPWS